jgi:hypothetical protein
MSFDITKGIEPTKVLDDVVRSLEALDQSIKRDVEFDMLPRSKVDSALSSLRMLQKMLVAGSFSEEHIGRTRKVLELVTAMNDPAKLTALGSMQTELSGMLQTVQQMLYKEDQKRAKKVDLDRMRGG